MIVVHFDVIANPTNDSFIKRQPSIEGRRLWNAFFEVYKGRMVVIADDNTDLNLIQEWLKREGYKPSHIHIASPFGRAGRSSRSEGVLALSSSLGKVTWYLDTDPSACAEVVRLGIPTLLVAVPQIQRPEWHDKEDIRSWDSLVEELEYQAIKKSEMTWDED